MKLSIDVDGDSSCSLSLCDEYDAVPSLWCNHSFMMVFFVFVFVGNLKSLSNGPTAASISKHAELTANGGVFDDVLLVGLYRSGDEKQLFLSDVNP